MKKTIIVLLVTVLCLLGAGCSSTESGNYDKRIHIIITMTKQRWILKR